MTIIVCLVCRRRKSDDGDDDNGERLTATAMGDVHAATSSSTTANIYDKVNFATPVAAYGESTLVAALDE